MRLGQELLSQRQPGQEADQSQGSLVMINKPQRIASLQDLGNPYLKHRGTLWSSLARVLILDGPRDNENTTPVPSSQPLIPQGRPIAYLGNWIGGILCPQKSFSAIQELWAGYGGPCRHRAIWLDGGKGWGSL